MNKRIKYYSLYLVWIFFLRSSLMDRIFSFINIDLSNDTWHLIILVGFKFFCQRHSELWPLYLAAVVDIRHVDDVLHLLLTRVDAPGNRGSSLDTRQQSSIIYTYARLKANINSLVEMWPSWLWSKSLKAALYFSTSSGLSDNFGFSSAFVKVLPPRMLAVLPSRLAIPPGAGPAAAIWNV